MTTTTYPGRCHSCGGLINDRGEVEHKEGCSLVDERVLATCVTEGCSCLDRGGLVVGTVAEAPPDYRVAVQRRSAGEWHDAEIIREGRA